MHLNWPQTIVGLVVCVVLLGALTLVGRTPCQGGCNVILIMVDTLSAKHLAVYGYDRDTMPKTTAFFREGAIFTDARSNAPWTLPSFSSMYFSDLASTITFRELDDDSRLNLPLVLRNAGVTLRVIRPQGENFIFDTVTRLFEPSEITWTEQQNESALDLMQEELTHLSQSDAPFFLVIHTFEAHDPYRPHEPFNEYFDQTEDHPVVTMQTLVAANQAGTPPHPDEVDVYRLRYDQQLAQTDTHLARVLHNIPPEILKDTVIIFSSDHGESFGEHGKLWHASSGLFDEELRVPLMMRVPDSPARIVADPVSLLDMAPTILTLMKLPVPDSFKGESLVPTLSGGSLGSRAIPFVNGFPFFRKPGDISNIQSNLEEAGAAGMDHPLIDVIGFGMYQNQQKVFSFSGIGARNGIHWYDLANDPNEQTDLAAEGLPTALQEALLRTEEMTR